MLTIGVDYPVEKYKDYKNRTIQQHLDKLNKQLWQIKQCSLKDEDKEKARQQILEAVKTFKF